MRALKNWMVERMRQLEALNNWKAEGMRQLEALKNREEEKKVGVKGLMKLYH